MESERKYYVYGYKRLDNNTFFYIGKGSNDRCKVKAPSVRTDKFLFIRNNLDYEYVIIHSNLTEEESYRLERETIEKLVKDEEYKIRQKQNEIAEEIKNELLKKAETEHQRNVIKETINGIKRKHRFDYLKK